MSETFDWSKYSCSQDFVLITAQMVPDCLNEKGWFWKVVKPQFSTSLQRAAAFLHLLSAVFWLYLGFIPGKGWCLSRFSLFSPLAIDSFSLLELVLRGKCHFKFERNEQLHFLLANTVPLHDAPAPTLNNWWDFRCRPHLPQRRLCLPVGSHCYTDATRAKTRQRSTVSTAYWSRHSFTWLAVGCHG